MPITLVYALPPDRLSVWMEAMKSLQPTWTLKSFSKTSPPLESPCYLIAWNSEPGLFSHFKKIDALFSLGAGVDFLFKDPNLPNVPIIRAVCQDLTERMVEYVTFHVLLAHRRHQEYTAYQAQKMWTPLETVAAREIRVGLMGLGVMGKACARALAVLGFQLNGWKKNPEDGYDFPVFFGSEGLAPFLAQTDILVSLLPHTPDTKGLITTACLRLLPHSPRFPHLPYFIAAGRGQVHIERDLEQALTTGLLKGASLDVFEHEPLPQTSPLWHHPKVVITPHIAAASDPHAISHTIAQAILQHQKGFPFENTVDRAAFY